MSLIRLRFFPDSILRKKSTEVDEDFLPHLIEIFDDVKKLLISKKGLGIAANQIGYDRRFFYIPSVLENSFIVNPRITDTKTKVKSFEGCLSIPYVYLKVPRFEEIDVEFFDFNNRKYNLHLCGKKSYCFQHELDHLNGILIIDHVSLYNLRRANSEFYVRNKIHLENSK